MKHLTCCLLNEKGAIDIIYPYFKIPVKYYAVHNSFYKLFVIVTK